MGIRKYLLAALIFFYHSICLGALHSDTLVLTVRPSQNDFESIQKALDTQTSGPLKVVLSGSFRIFDVLITKRHSTTIEFTQGAVLHLMNRNTGGILLQHNNCHVKNGYIKGSAKSALTFYEGYGVMFYGVSNCSVQNTVFDRISGLSIYLAPNERNKGCVANYVFNNRIINPAINLIGNGDESGILLGYSGKGYSHRDNIIKNNFIDGNNVLKVGIGIIGHGNNNTFWANEIKNCLCYGIISYESQSTDTALSGSKILHNAISNIGQVGDEKTVKGMGIYLMKSHNSVVKGNKVYNTLRNSDRSETLGAGAITTSGSVGSLVDSNYIDGSEMYGYVNDYSFNSIFSNNTILNTRKSGAYFINVNNVKVVNNTFRNIGEVVFKGYFEHTSLPYIKQQWRIKTYLNQSTGNNIIIENNHIYSGKDILYFTGTAPEKNNRGNTIFRNYFKGNRIYGNVKKISNLVFYREEKSGENYIINNVINK